MRQRTFTVQIRLRAYIAYYAALRSNCPRDILDIEYNNSSEIYSLGALIDAMQTAKRPFGDPAYPEYQLATSEQDHL